MMVCTEGVLLLLKFCSIESKMKTLLFFYHLLVMMALRGKCKISIIIQFSYQLPLLNRLPDLVRKHVRDGSDFVKLQIDNICN